MDHGRFACDVGDPQPQVIIMNEQSDQTEKPAEEEELTLAISPEGIAPAFVEICLAGLAG